MLRREHYVAAEALLDEGVAVVKRISSLAGMRQMSGQAEAARFTVEMDELGKKAMGIWAQAQVHALLSQDGAGKA